MTPNTFSYRVGVDIGGTNTDAALVRSDWVDGKLHQEVVAGYKSKTTADVTGGICNAVEYILRENAISPSNVLSVNIGTTHFINAVVQADSSKLRRVAVLRLCGPFAREVSPFSVFPPRLRNIVEGYSAYLDGGLEIDGRVIKQINREEVISHARKLRELQIKTAVVCGVFSPLDSSEVTQEDAVKQILQEEIPGIDVVCSRHIGRLGFLERENASILNASILAFGRHTVGAIQSAMESLDLHCMLYLTQNDGTVMDAESAKVFPIKTFSSGATNSLAGAIFLSDLHNNKDIDLKSSQVMMVDVGGTTSDCAALSPSGFPRQSSAVVNIAGVRTAFSIPDIQSIGLGGGSIVSIQDEGKVTVGPKSVGHELETRSQCFGGNQLTATDLAVANGLAQSIQPSWLNQLLPDPSLVHSGLYDIKRQLENLVDSMRVSTKDVILLLVGGGSVIISGELEGVKKCFRPKFHDVANAVGAAISKVGGEIDRPEIPDGTSTSEIMDRLKSQAIELAIKNGAVDDTVEIVEVEAIPLQYVTNNAFRAVVKAVGQLGTYAPGKETKMIKSEDEVFEEDVSRQAMALSLQSTELNRKVELASYRPKVIGGLYKEWIISELDLRFIEDGVGVLGTGGGGSAYLSSIQSIEMLQRVGEGKMRVIDPGALKEGAAAIPIAYMGAPSVSNERLLGDSDMKLAAESIAKYLNIQKFDGVLPAEIGGSNGMRPFSLGAQLDIPIIDADSMGRAYPKIDMCLPFVYNKADLVPTAMADERGNVQIVTSIESRTRLENLLRGACIEYGVHSAICQAPYSREIIQNYCVPRTISSAWYIGRAIHQAKASNADVIDTITATISGATRLYSGKIVNIDREIRRGFDFGKARLEVVKEYSETSTETRSLLIEYQNEFLCASLENDDGSVEVICTTPDLISIIDQDGCPLGSHEIRFGLRVNVIAMPSHPKWVTPEGLAAAGPAAFGINSPYKPISERWENPESVIAQFG